MINSRIGLLGTLLLGVILSSAGARADEVCGDWGGVASPNPAVVNRVLHIAGRSSTDLWLLGSAGATYPGTPMIWHWNGAGWSTIPLPDTSSLGSLPQFNAITQLPDGDLLVGGDVRTSYPIDNQPFVARWNGSAWVEVMRVTLRPQTVYPYGARGGLVYDLVAAGPNDIWAFGHAASMGSGGSVAMAVHYDGSAWTEYETPIVGNRTNQLIAADGSGSSDIWAVGVRRDIAGAYLPYTMHWDGESWTYHAAPAGLTGSFDAIAAVSPTHAWALGASVMVRWDGSAWQSMPLPAGASSAAIQAVSPGDIWVAHMTGGYFHWNGSAWSFVPSPFTPPSGRFTQIRDFVQVGPCDLWAAGSVLALDGSAPSTTIVERLSASATAGDVDGDGDVDLSDLTLLLSSFGACSGDPSFDAAADFDGSGCVELADLAVLLANFGA